ncbi:MAG: SDR family NAD(P)-dependent oxidoreductase [Pseudomonadota bacterium]
MTFQFAHFGTGSRAVVIGAGGGLGAAFVRAIVEADAFKTVYALSRSGRDISGAQAIAASVTDPDSLTAAADTIRADGPIDLALIATGVLHGDALQPEKTYRALEWDAMRRVFEINTFGPALAAKAFLPLLAKDRRAVLAALSARVGSISDNGLGGWHSYRASKAALNMMLRNFAIEMSRRAPQAIILGLHPGTVDTDLSKPFQSGVKTLFTPDISAAHLLSVIDAAKPADSGKLFAWDGAEIGF